ncbi:MAG TPA: FAD-dependent monooxygenase [Phycisphaerales bacterium]|nr:FAD-dependent monooxygenase [Phycisphaerales bacterium]HMP36402.1 FAD-dependent monooxygenase [Phycisphaerales bacterium]
MGATPSVVVIGGGPAGSVAAILLGRLGWSVTLIERGPRGRPKCCGHCLGPRGVAALERLGLGEAVSAARVGGYQRLSVHLAVPSRRDGVRRASFEMALSADDPQRRGVLVDRRALDAALLDRAEIEGVEVRRGLSARLGLLDDGTPRIEVGDGSWIEPALIVGADGLGSGVARAAGLAGRAGRSYGFAFDLDVSPGSCGGRRDGLSAISRGQHEDQQPPGSVAMHVVPEGYLGLVRSETGVLHGAALVRMSARRERRFPWSPRAAASAMGRSDASRESDAKRAAARTPARFLALLAERFDDAAIAASAREAAGGSSTLGRPAPALEVIAAGPMPWRPQRRACRPGGRHSAAVVALVGDAGGYVEPFTGEGMTWAVASAVALAEAAERPGRFDSEGYERAWRNSIAAAQRRCALIAGAVRCPAIVTAAATLLPRVTGLIARRLADWSTRPPQPSDTERAAWPRSQPSLMRSAAVGGAAPEAPRLPRPVDALPGDQWTGNQWTGNQLNGNHLPGDRSLAGERPAARVPRAAAAGSPSAACTRVPTEPWSDLRAGAGT